MKVCHRITRPPSLSLACLALAGAMSTLASCGASAAGDACRAGDPQPIFAPTDSTVVEHDFRAEGQESLETTAFRSGLLLAIEQAGCDTLAQTFTFAHPRLSPDFDTFMVQGPQTFYELAGLSASVAGLGEYARVLGGARGEILQGQPAILAPGFTLRVIRLPTPGKVTWSVRFEQDFGAPPGGR